MNPNISIDSIYALSEEIVAREIEGELIIVPLTSGIGDMEDDLFTLNETGRSIWNLLDGQRSLRDIAAELSILYKAAPGEIEQDLVGIVTELLSRKMLVEIIPD
jgi:hypothetical protein